jgi:predicted phosphodiesterase
VQMERLARVVGAVVVWTCLACHRGEPRDAWIQDATSSSVTIAWEPERAGGMQRLVWGNPPHTTVEGERALGGLYEAKVTGLPPAATYGYYVLSGHTRSAMGRFETAPAGASPFRFAVLGDTHGNFSGHDRVVHTILPFAPDFVLHTGDIESHHDTYREFFQVEEKLLRNAVIFPSPGNHDHFRDYHYAFARPTWYSFRWGNAFFVSISTKDAYLPGSAQYEWVESQLQAARADPSITWIFAYHHYPVWSSGPSGWKVNVAASLNELYTKYRVDMVFSGHDHDYERVERDGVVYVVTGGGSVTTSVRGATVDGQEYFEAALHGLIVDVDGNSLDLRAYRADGSIMDARHLQHGPSASSDGSTS